MGHLKCSPHLPEVLLALCTRDTCPGFLDMCSPVENYGADPVDNYGGVQSHWLPNTPFTVLLYVTNWLRPVAYDRLEEYLGSQQIGSDDVTAMSHATRTTPQAEETERGLIVGK